MGNRLRILLIIILLGGGALLAFFWLRPETGAAYGPAVTLCPGPDQYGYTCQGGGGFAYVDATQDTRLYADDGLTTVPLPFPFTFYGTVYEEITLNSNGAIHFDTAVPQYQNTCLSNGPAPDMGDMLAPYWDDLDLTMAGFLETETVGTAPERIFVIEWDSVPRFDGELEDSLTFAVQLFEGSNDIVFLYQDVVTDEAPRGADATIGLQSEAQGVALQFSCNQPAVADTSAVYFPHPAEPNADLGMTAVAQTPPLAPNFTALAKGPAVDLLAAPGALPAWQARWAKGNPPRHTEAAQIDLTGNGRNELLLLWHSDRAHPQLTQAAVLGRDGAAPAASAPAVPLFFHSFSRRGQPAPRVTLAETADLTGDGVLDALLVDEENGRLFALSDEEGRLRLYDLPGRCSGQLRVGDFNQDGQVEIGREQCQGQNGRMMAAWTGREFTLLPQ